MSVSKMCPVNGIGTIRAVRIWLDGFLFLRSENENSDQAKEYERTYGGQNNGQNMHAYTLRVWLREFKRGVASC